MFTGLIEEMGTIGNLERRGEYQLIEINARTIMDDLKKGDSVAVNGVCQTVTAFSETSFSVETLAVSLDKTNLGSLKKGDRVNLERALAAGSRIAGHLVQGHVDGKGRITAVRKRAENIFLEVLLPEDLVRYCTPRGSITLEGISLTIAEKRGSRIIVNIIPTTWQDTVLQFRRTGDLINIETDLLARYTAGILDHDK